jgi:preprotein translocase subunit SecD
MNWSETAGWMLVATAILGCGSSIEEGRPAAAVSPLLEVRTAYSEPAPGLEVVEYGEQVLHVVTEPVVSDVDFLDVQSVLREGQVLLSIQCTQEANERFEAATRSHVGQPMVVLVGSQARSAAIVRASLQCSSLQVAVEASAEEAEHLIAKVQERWPPQSE